jgi:hypothetical protein
VLDAAHDNPGVSAGATRGVAGKFGEAAQITASGAITIPDAIAFAIDPAVGFTVEMFANLAAAPAATDTVAFAQKRPRFGQSDSPGWALALEPAGAGHALAFTLTDSAGVVVRAAAAATLPVGSWFHVAGVIDPAAGQARVLLNGTAVASAPPGALALVDTGADVGLGGDSFGASHLNGAIDEVRFSSVARTDFSTCWAPRPNPTASTPRPSRSTTSTKRPTGSTRTAASTSPRTAARREARRQGSQKGWRSRARRCLTRAVPPSRTSS